MKGSLYFSLLHLISFLYFFIFVVTLTHLLRKLFGMLDVIQVAPPGALTSRLPCQISKSKKRPDEGQIKVKLTKEIC